jgi:hypothetical protein
MKIEFILKIITFHIIIQVKMDSIISKLDLINISTDDIENTILKLSNNFTQIISIDEIKLHSNIYWGGNGIGDRFCNKKFNYSVIYSNKKIKLYSENLEDFILDEITSKFFELNKNKKGFGIIGIFIHSKRNNITKRPISKEIDKIIKESNCIVCGTFNDIICDHKNDLYNDERVLNVKTQVLEDFQPLCNHCNLQKRQVSKKECELNKIYSAKNIPRYKIYNFQFPWEKKNFDIFDKNTKIDTYWYDPVEFDRKISIYWRFVFPIVEQLKHKNL